MASTYLSRTLSASPTNQKILTYSFWAKRSGLSAYMYNLVGNTSAPYVTIGFDDTDRFSFQLQAGTGSVGLTSTSKYRDTSAWYHIVCVLDTTQATDSNRMKVYINGVQITDFDTANYPTQNSTWNINTNVEHGVGGSSVIQDFDGYMAQVYFIDGQALDASYFGQTDSTGTWKPKGYSGSYGTNGFYLKFSNSGSLGADSSGNGNDFTKTGSGRQRTDTPSNVFASLNGVLTFTSGVLSAGNLIHTGTAGTTSKAYSTLAVPSGKWYAEVKNPNGSQKWRAGVRRADYMYFNDNEGIVLDYNFIYQQNTEGGTSEAVSWSGNDHIIGIALNKDDNQVTFYVDGSQIGSVQSLANTDKSYCFFSDDYSSSAPDAGVFQWNFGNPSFTVSSGNADANGYGNFEYAPPTGYLALCTKNLAAEISSTVDDPSAYFNTVLYTGTGSSQGITGVGFQPDFTWIKIRNTADSHGLVDSTRGATKHLRSDSTASEFTRATDVSSFDSDGFTVVSDAQFNGSGNTYASWNWKANGGTTGTQSGGTISATVQKDTARGFSIGTYTGTGSDGTVETGLTSALQMVWVKRTNAAADWAVGVGTNITTAGARYLCLNSTDAFKTSGENPGERQHGTINISGQTTGYFQVNTSATDAIDVGANGSTYVFYAWHSVEGYSKIDRYTGNGSANGPFIYTGFKPAFLIIKRTDSTNNWNMFDIKRDTYNQVGKLLYPNLSAEEQAAGVHSSGNDILSNGFKLRQTGAAINASGGSYLYMAFAEHPFVTSGGLPVTAR